MSAISLDDPHGEVAAIGTGTIGRLAWGSMSFYVVTDRQGHCSDNTVFELKWDRLDYMAVARLVESNAGHFHFFAPYEQTWTIGDDFRLCLRDGEYRWLSYGRIVAILHGKARIGDDRDILEKVSLPPRTP